MASRAQLVITVTSSRGGSTVTYTTKGRYVSFITNTLRNILVQQPLFTTSTPQVFWGQVINVVEADIGGES